MLFHFTYLSHTLSRRPRVRGHFPGIRCDRFFLWLLGIIRKMREPGVALVGFIYSNLTKPDEERARNRCRNVTRSESQPAPSQLWKSGASALTRIQSLTGSEAPFLSLLLSPPPSLHFSRMCSSSVGLCLAPVPGAPPPVPVWMGFVYAELRAWCQFLLRSTFCCNHPQTNKPGLRNTLLQT